MARGNEGIRWGRALVAALIVEVLLALAAAPVALLAADPMSTLRVLVPLLSFVVAALVVAWLFRSAERPVANGLATGLICLAIYVVLVIAAYWLSPEQVPLRDSVSLTNIASYLLRFAGGAAGGYLIARKKAAGAASTFE